MNKLDELRIEIDSIDEEMRILFEKRMTIVKEIGNYKKENSIPILNQNREKEVITKNVNKLKDNSLEPYYITFIQTIMDISKKYQ